MDGRLLYSACIASVLLVGGFIPSSSVAFVKYVTLIIAHEKKADKVNT